MNSSLSKTRLLRSCTESFAWGSRNLKMLGALVCTSAMEVTSQFAWELADRPCKHDQQMVLSHAYEAYPAYPTKSYPWFFSHVFHRSSSSPYLIPPAVSVGKPPSSLWKSNLCEPQPTELGSNPLFSPQKRICSLSSLQKVVSNPLFSLQKRMIVWQLESGVPWSIPIYTPPVTHERVL